MASVSLADLTPDTRERAEAFLAAAAGAGFKLVVISTLRTCADQGNGGTVIIHGIPIKTMGGCRSWHVFGRAFDVEIQNDPSEARYAQLGAIGKSLGISWGGDFPANYDPVHFQYTPGMDIRKICPEPNDCEAAVKGAAPVPSPEPMPVPTPVPVEPASKASSAGPAVFALGLLVGWWAARRLRSS